MAVTAVTKIRRSITPENWLRKLIRSLLYYPTELIDMTTIYHSILASMPKVYLGFQQLFLPQFG